MRFEALELSLEVFRSLRQVAQLLRQRDPDDYKQLRRAAKSILKNIAEGRRRSGADRLYHYRIAAGSADEVLNTLRGAEAWGELNASSIEKPLLLLDRLLAILWRLTH